jgi:multidrug transporter EmrE-like cation transporter
MTAALLQTERNYEKMRMDLAYPIWLGGTILIAPVMAFVACLPFGLVIPSALLLSFGLLLSLVLLLQLRNPHLQSPDGHQS